MTNVGSLDRILRAILGIVLFILPIVPSPDALSGLGGWIWVLPAFGTVLLLTAILRTCPAYTLLGMRT